MKSNIASFLLNMSRALLVREVAVSSPPPPSLRPPPLSFSRHKGEMGRVGVLGGSPEFTGAPFYASKSSLLIGADLVFIFCAREALLPIKSYSPEFMVTALYDGQQVVESGQGDNEADELLKKKRAEVDVGQVMLKKMKEYMWKLHAVVVGPGLGRCELLVPGLLQVIELIVAEEKQLVLDADAIWLICHKLETVRGCRSCILTPNIREFDMLITQSLLDVDQVIAQKKVNGQQVHQEQGYLSEHLSLQDLEDLRLELNGEPVDETTFKSTCVGDTRKYLQLRALCRSLGGVTVLLKGQNDAVSMGGAVLLLTGEEGSPRRCGGQGDILAGAVAVAMHWASRFPTCSNDQDKNITHICPNMEEPERRLGVKDIQDLPPTLSASLFAAMVTKRASKLAFERRGRSTTSPDILEEIGAVVTELEGGDAV